MWSCAFDLWWDSLGSGYDLGTEQSASINVDLGLYFTDIHWLKPGMVK